MLTPARIYLNVRGQMVRPLGSRFVCHKSDDWVSKYLITVVAIVTVVTLSHVLTSHHTDGGSSAYSGWELRHALHSYLLRT